MAVDTQPPSPTLQPQEVIAGRYEVLELIAEGGMGSIYAGKQLGLGRKVAIKTLQPRHSTRSDLVARFRREARAAQRLTHPNTVRVYDFGETEGGLLYLVMEYLEGRTLDVVLSNMGKLPAPVVTHIGRQVLKSLVEAHAHKIVHRDIKPSNLMLCRQLGELNLVKVLDFGLARIIQQTGDGKDAGGSRMGTPHFMSPEQVGSKPIDHRSDLYSLGLTLFELATGQHAFDGESAYEVAMRHLSPEPVELPKDLEGTRLGNVIARATQKDPTQRYQSAEEMLSALSGIDPAKTDEAMALLDLLHSDDRLPETMIPGMTHAQDGLATENLTRLAIEGEHRKTRRLLVVLVLLVTVAVALAVFEPQLLSDRNTQRRGLDELARLDAPDGLEAAGSSMSRAAVEPAPEESRVDRTRPEELELSPSVRLVVLSEPTGAAVLLDDQVVCKTPCDRMETLESEPSNLVVMADGFEPAEQEVVLSRNVYLSVALTPVPEPVSDRSERSSRRRERAEEPESDEASEPADETTGRRRALPIDF